MKRNTIILITIITLFIGKNINAQEVNNKINWMSFEEAVKLNETAPKKIFIDVFTDWCGWCTKMDKTTFLDKDVVSYMNDNFYAVKFNAEQAEAIEFKGYTFINENPLGARKGTHQLAAALLQGKLSYPSYVFMNENNQVLTVVPGYIEPQNLLQILSYFATDAYKTIEWKDYSTKEAQ